MFNSMLRLAGVLSVAALAWSFASFAAEKDAISSAGILTTNGNENSMMILTDGEEQAVKYLYTDSFDKNSVKNVFSISRVQFTYTKGADGARKLLSFKKEPPQATGTVTGVVFFVDPKFWVAVKPKDGPPDGYALSWPPENFKDVFDRIKTIKKGDTVTIKFHTDFERHRIDSLEINQKAAK